MFTRPQPAPPLRGGVARTLRLPDNPAARVVDGLGLRVENPQQALEVLQPAGVPQLDRPHAWFRRYRRVTSVPAAPEQVTTVAAAPEWVSQRRTRHRWIYALAAVCAVSGGAARAVAAFVHGPSAWWLPTPILAMCGAAATGCIWLARWHMRTAGPAVSTATAR